MRLLLGPPGSGKSTRILGDIKARLRDQAFDFRLLVPTATMAQHLRNSLSRRGFVVPAECIQTLAAVVDSIEGGPRQATPAEHWMLMRDAVGEEASPAFADVADFTGFLDLLVSTQSELLNAGCDSLEMEALRNLGILRGPQWAGAAAIFARVEGKLEERSLALRAPRLLHAASHRRWPASVRTIYFDGFFSFTLAETDFVRAACRDAEVTVSLPEWPGARTTVAALERAGFRTERLHAVRTLPEEILVGAGTMTQEAEEIARRIRAEAASGRPWADIAVLLRDPWPYLPLLRTTLARFDIPARYYFTESLDRHPVGLFFVSLIRAALGGWNEPDTRRVLESPLLVRGTTIESLKALDPLFAGQREPQEWERILAGLVSSIDPPRVEEGPSVEAVTLCRYRAAGLRSFVLACEETAAALKSRPLIFASFWAAALDLMRFTPVREQQTPHNVVSVMDVYEARQWERPVVFVCGLLEGLFPRHPSPEALLTDSVRVRLAGHGLRIDTALDRTREEEWISDFAQTRATERLFLSWHRFDAAANPTLRAFALARNAGQEEPARSARPAPLRDATPLPRPVLYRAEVRAVLAERHRVQRPTAIESFLQCPFQFYGRYTLELREQLEPGVIDVRDQGSLIHRLIAAWYADPSQDIGQLFEKGWAVFLGEKRVADGYRAEQARSGLLRALRDLEADPRIEPGWRIVTEQPVSVELAGTLVRGRVDRFDVNSRNECTVFDFKYTSDEGVRKRIQKQREGLAVQGGLYLLALRRAGLIPVSFEFAALRGGLNWRGWNEPAQIEELITQASDLTADAARRIDQGEIQPSPSDRDLCRYCEFRDACRIGSESVVRLTAGFRPGE
jgi:ATP-dependent helicase/DNAse subunit B